MDAPLDPLPARARGLPVAEVVNGGAMTGQTVAARDWRPVGDA